jgi:tetratricopeptide (TPR) repeat protein
MVSVSTQRILYEGIATMERLDLVLAGLGDLDRRVKINAVAPFAFDVDECTPEERAILGHAQRAVSVRRLAWQTGGPAFERLRTVYQLVASGLLVPADAAEETPQPVVTTETGTFLLSTLQRQPDPKANDAIRREVQQELERSATLDRQAWLRVSRTAPREDLVRALEEKMERYHALRDACGEDDHLRTDIELILGRASSMLRLARQPAPGRREEKKDEKPAADAGAPGRPAADEEPPAPSPAEPTAAAAAPAPGARVVEGLGGIHRSLDQMVLDAEVRMTIADYANAVKIYQQIVTLAPDDSKHRARLAIAMASYPRTAKRAEREFQEAIRLAPDNPDLHYQLGMYYKVMKQTSRAIGEMRTALRLNRKHALARRELEALSPKDAALFSLKKIFE